MRDPLINIKNTIENFVRYLREHGGVPTESVSDATIEAFLATQFPNQSRAVPTCGHCGSDNVKEGDFKNELLWEADKNHPDGGTWSKKADPKSAGPAWVCQIESCGSYTPREAKS